MADDFDFDGDRYRAATDAMVEAGFDDVAEWVRDQIDRRERSESATSLEARSLADVSEALFLQARALDEIAESVDLEAVQSLRLALETSAHLVDWLRGETYPEAFALRPTAEGTWRMIGLAPELRQRARIFVICPICLPLIRPYSSSLITLERVRVRDFRMVPVRVDVPGRGLDLSTLFVGRCEGCGQAFAA